MFVLWMIYCLVMLVIYFIASIPTLIFSSVSIFLMIGFVYLMNMAFSSILVLIPTYVLPVIGVTIVIGVIFKFGFGKTVNALLAVLALEFAFFLAYTHLPVNVMEFSDVSKIVVVKENEALEAVIEEESKIIDILNAFENTKTNRTFEEWIDSPIVYEVQIQNNEDTTIYFYNNNYIQMDDKYYQSDDDLMEVFDDEINRIRYQNQNNYLNEHFGSQITSLKNSIQFNEGILSFVIPNDMPDTFELEIHATENQGGVYIKRDFLFDESRNQTWIYGKHYIMKVGNKDYSNLRMEIEIDNIDFDIDLREYLD